MLLAIERSSTPGSAALLHGDGRLECAIEEAGAGRGDAFSLVSGLLQKASTDMRYVTRFAVGIGPGSFSGIRSAISLLSGLAVPIGAVVEGIGSAPAAAYAYRKAANDHSALAVVGDARRGNIWVASFPACNAETQSRVGHAACIQEHNDPASDVRLVPRDGLVAAIGDDAIVLTPDWGRIGEFLSAAFGGSRVHHVVPTAQAVGALALRCKAAPAIPLYMQPAVATTGV